MNHPHCAKGIGSLAMAPKSHPQIVFSGNVFNVKYIPDARNERTLKELWKNFERPWMNLEWNEWMNEWMNEWKNEWITKGMNEWMNERTELS